MILGIDTTGKKLKLGLTLDSSIRLREVSDQPKHAQHILPEILALLKEHQKSLKDLSALAFSQGPGSFTGLRIGLGVVQGLAYGLNLPVIPVPTMSVLASVGGSLACVDDVFVAVFARDDEVYGAFYRDAQKRLPNLVEGPGVYTAKNLPEITEGKWFLVGDGAYLFEKGAQGYQFHQTIVSEETDMQVLLQMAEALLNAGHAVSALEAGPLYVREMVARPQEK